MEDVAMLVKRADQGLYIAKDQGRNRVGTMARTV
jgi:PleD family two-component response regulator